MIWKILGPSSQRSIRKEITPPNRFPNSQAMQGARTPDVARFHGAFRSNAPQWDPGSEKGPTWDDISAANVVCYIKY